MYHMGSNLPPMDPIHKRNAPWNQENPEPDSRCPYCQGRFDRVKTRSRYPDQTTHVHESRCPHCDKVLHATRLDVTDSYLESWRKYPEEMMGTIDRFAELKDMT